MNKDTKAALNRISNAEKRISTLEDQASTDESDPLPEIDQAHRALGPKPNPDKPPRTIIWRLLRGALLFEGQRFFVRQDLAMEIQKQRAAYKDILEKVKNTGLRFGLILQDLSSLSRERLSNMNHRRRH
ncbi:hypothetical protein F7725_013367 [Dissostichus mawsoni]|uniref:Uncharacterized protein n=1 Tax=Dissostichus mawsoni TaxID=36200 RepID=A0A7J5YQ68_DISMA|nr:hypothetical protein F7725_013367 [Dissostichus mawsoni]